jgi:hypothetical protein
MVEKDRSTEDIRQDIAKEKEKISQKVDQIGERIKEKLDWREYAKDYPYWVLGVGAGLGYLTSKVLIPRTTPMERIMGSISDEVRGALGGMIPDAVNDARPGLVKLTLVGMATKAANNWLKKAIPR